MSFTLTLRAPDVQQRSATLITANPQIANPNLITPGQTVHLPGASPGHSVAPGSAAQPVGPVVPGDAASVAAAIARRYLHRNASELKRNGDLPMDASVASNTCCANFVSAMLQRAGLLPDRLHTNSVDQLDSTLRDGGEPSERAVGADRLEQRERRRHAAGHGGQRELGAEPRRRHTGASLDLRLAR